MPRRRERAIDKRTVDALAVEGKDAVFWDHSLHGFGRRVHPSGLKQYKAPCLEKAWRGRGYRLRHLGAIMSILYLFTAMLFLTSCAQIQSNVQNFSNLPLDYAGKQVAVLGYPEKINESLEWNSYKPIFEEQFRKEGFVVSSIDDADYVAFVTYEIGDPQTSTHVGSTPVIGQTGEGTTGVVGTSIYSYDTTNYIRTVAIDLVEKESNEKVFKGEATSSGECGILSEVIDEIAESMFKKFPSGSGRVAVDKKADC